MPVLHTGDRVAGYRIESPIGTGGMAAVYRAVDEQLGRQVALKIMQPSYLPETEKDVRLRFVRESRAAALVDHPNIIPIYAAGESDGVLFIAMRLVRGGDIRTLLGGDPLSPELVMNIIRPVADALDAAHEAGLVHRDVKPGNMLLETRQNGQDHVYLTDFGITVFNQERGDLTAPGVVVGTLNYMSPEQLQGSAIDGHADQWGLACSAFELLAGEPPYSRSQLAGTFQAIISESPPSLAGLRPGVRPDVDAVFARGLAKDPGDRYATCAQFAAALSAALGLDTASVPSWMLSDARSAEPRARPAEPLRDDPDLDTAGHGQPDSLDVALKRSFRYIHEPSRADDDAIPSLGNDELIAKLEKRIRHSRGGTFLITGFRGVGKSTLVMRALDELASRSGPSDVVIPVSLSVARSTTTERLLFAIVRRIFETLSDEQVLERLPPQTRHALLVSYMRTSLSYKETQSRYAEQSAGLNVGLGSGKLVKTVANIAAPQLSMSASRSQSLATEAAFLAYSETDVEYDLMRIISLVNRTLDTAGGRRRLLRRLRPSWLQRHGLVASPSLRLVIVLDEVDKLTADDKGMAAVEELLSGTKNVLTMSGAHFLVIAGPDLQDRAMRDAARGTGVYESVFGWRLYVPCLWDAPERLIEDVVRVDGQWEKDTIELVVRYLRFKARGVPRRLLQEINAFVSWHEDQPRLMIGARDLERVAFYARMEEILREFMERTDRTRLVPVAIDEDRWRLGSYFVVDWVLQSEGTPFTAADLLREGEDARFDPLLRISRRSIDRLLDHLADHQILEVVRGQGFMNTVMADVRESAEKVFRLSGDIRHLLFGFAEQRDAKTQQLGVSRPLERRPGGAQSPRVIAGRYELGEIISQGSLSTVFKGQDVTTGRQVAIKLLLPALAEDAVALARFRREAEIARKLDHTQVVRTYAFIDGPDDFAIITERLLGQTLEEQVQGEGAMAPGEVAGLGHVLADGLTYLASEQVVRLDLKPTNIVMADRGPVITDLGIALQRARDVSRLTDVGVLIGTPAFMAPELLSGNAADTRSDIYSLGLVMYYCLAGKNPWADLPNLPAVMNAVLTERLDMSGLGVSPAFQKVIERATAPEPGDRFSDALQLRDALRMTPELRDLRSPTVTQWVVKPDATRADVLSEPEE